MHTLSDQFGAELKAFGCFRFLPTMGVRAPGGLKKVSGPFDKRDPKPCFLGPFGNVIDCM